MRPISLCACAAAAAVVSSYSPCSAYFFGTRIVERIGNTDIPLGASVAFFPGTTHRLRLQIGVFDDASGPAPAGGINGYTDGIVSTSGGGTWTRTPGRLAPFTFFQGPNGNGNPPLPGGDPFLNLTLIDAAIASQGLTWVCDAQGQPLPMPQPAVRARNVFVSTYEVSVALSPSQASDIHVAFGGHLTAAAQWLIQGNPTPPDCENNEAGSVFYFARLDDFQPFFAQELLITPAPGSAALLLGAVGLTRRRRN